MRIKSIVSSVTLLVLCAVCAAPAPVLPPRPPSALDDASHRAASRVSPDSLSSMLRFLCFDPGTGLPRSRFTFREVELAGVADSLAKLLERYTGCTVERSTFTVLDEYYDPDEHTAENLMVRLSGTADDSSVVIVCAHYDAIGVRTEGWRENWETLPAPGADDNGTGVAALMEAARILPGYALPFDLQFVLFSGEELGKLGSIDFVDRCDSTCSGRILGVFNLDMIGYNEDGTHGGSILSNYSSGWMADMIVDALFALDPDLSMQVIKPGPFNWDHAPFWEYTWKGESRPISAVTFAEPLYRGGFILYPYYHTVRDTIGWIDLGQVERITKVLVGFIAGFEDLPAEMSMLPSDILLRGEETFLGAETFPVGETITATVRCRNRGGEIPPVQTAITLEVTLENAAGVRTLYTGPVEASGPLRASDKTIRFTVSPRDAGENRLRARISVSGFDDGTGDNETVARFIVGGAGAGILAGYHFQPNPITGPFSDAEFCINLAAGADILVDLFTIEGDRIGTAHIGTGYGRPLEIGNTCFPCRELFPGVTNLASGIYVYRLKVYAAEGTQQHAGRFAVVN